MRALKVCLWVIGVLCLAALVGLVLPMATLESMAGAFGDATFPKAPVVTYVVRTFSATFAAIGVFFILLARDPMRYGVMVPFAGVAAAALGVICGITGAATGIPLLWYLGDCVSCLLAGALVLVLWRRATADGEPSAGPSASEAD